MSNEPLSAGPRPEVNFDAADLFLREARAAHDRGDKHRCSAACRMVGIALQITDAPPIDIRIKHHKMLEKQNSQSVPEKA